MRHKEIKGRDGLEGLNFFLFFLFLLILLTLFMQLSLHLTHDTFSELSPASSCLAVMAELLFCLITEPDTSWKCMRYLAPLSFFMSCSIYICFSKEILKSSVNFIHKSNFMKWLKFMLSARAV